MNEQTTIDKLEQLGFKKAHSIVKKMAEKKRKMAIAYEHFRFVRQEKIDNFNQKLKEKTFQREGYREMYQQLTFTPVGEYAEVPPADVLGKLEEALGLNCFDAFEIAHIVSVVKIPDPLLFGRINGCPDRFFIAQWDNDVKIEDLLATNEG